MIGKLVRCSKNGPLGVVVKEDILCIPSLLQIYIPTHKIYVFRTIDDLIFIS